MRKLLLVLLTLMLVIGVAGCDNERVVEFEDSNLEAAVREEINKPDGVLYLSDVKSIKELDASGREIESIEGIQFLRG